MTAESFEDSPIIFGDFIKMGADTADKVYEELADMRKLTNVLGEVRGVVNLEVNLEMRKIFIESCVSFLIVFVL